ncbi:MAG TPA: hypothetical protein VGG29_03885 [Caulobacteraceae bacterium]|jgi:hypothetical protein
MPDLDLRTLKKRGLSVLRISAGDWYDLQQSRGQGARFTSVFPHAVARSGKAKAPVILVIAGDAISHDDDSFYQPHHQEPHLRIAWINSIQAVATRDSRVAFDHVQSVTPGTLEALIGLDVPARFMASAANLIAGHGEFDAVSPRLGEWLLDRLAALPANDAALRRLAALVDRPSQFRSALALQQDALALALKAFGAPAAEASSLALTRRTTALAAARAQENLVIAHDARWIPGWRLEDSDITGRAVFRQDHRQLEVFTANHEDLERLFGVDLIYLNQTRRSIVMVQYKMMEPLPRKERKVKGLFGDYTEREDAEWVVPINDQFKDELARMMRFDQPAVGEAGSYRMNPSPFFFKLVRRNGSTNGAGILLSLGHLQQLLGEGRLAGPRGGLRIAYSELQGHYLRSENFVDLVQSGYIGSHGATTDHFETLIETTLSEGRAVVAAIQSALADTRWSDFDPTMGPPAPA